MSSFKVLRKQIRSLKSVKRLIILSIAGTMIYNLSVSKEPLASNGNECSHL